MKNRNKNLKILKELFWDYKWDSVVEKLDSPFVIAKVLEIGNKEQAKELEKAIGVNKIKDFLEKYENFLSKQSLNFWRLCYVIQSKRTQYDELVIKKAINSFEDAEKEPEILIFKKVRWDTIKNFFIKEFARI